MRAVFLVLCLALTAAAQAPEPDTTSPQTLAQLNFLLGTWSARTIQTKGSPAIVLGEYTFRPDLLKSVITRVSATDACAVPKSTDCQHYEALTVYRDPPDPLLHALYLDSQGHTIHYNLSFPEPNTAIFYSTSPGTQSRLIYHLQKNILIGKLQTAPPGSTNFTSSLEWFGVRITPTDPPPGKPTMTHALDTLEDVARVVLLFAPQSADPQFTQQLVAFASHDRDFNERNLILIPVLATWSPTDKDLYDRNLPFTDPAEQAYIRQRFKIPRATFTVLLIGKDGLEKFRSHTPVTAAKLFGTIDVMPMRRQEMHNR